MLTRSERLPVFAAHTRARLTLLSKEPPYRIRFVGGDAHTPMGSWTFRQAEKLHEIALSLFLDEVIPHCRDKHLLAEQVYFHEISHSLWTDRDFEGLHRELTKEHPIVSHRLHNLFEDARIESLWRRSTGRRFGWRRWLTAPWSAEKSVNVEELRPEDFFLFMVHSEGDPSALLALRRQLSSLAIHLTDTLARVEYYYRLAIEENGRFTRTSFDLIPLCREWLRDFPHPEGDSPGLPGGVGQPGRSSIHGGDLYTPAPPEEEKTGDSARRGGRPPRPLSSVARRILLARNRFSDRPLPAELLFEEGIHRHRFDPRKVDGLEAGLVRALQRRGGKGRSLSPRRQICTRAYLRGSRYIYRGRTPETQAPSRLMYLHDCSGSMRGSRELHGLAMLQLMNRLHKRRAITAKVYLCFGGFSELEMPFDEDRLYSLASHGPHEGFENCLIQNESVVHWADRVVIYTDGRISDQPIDRSRWRRQGVESYGLLVDKTESGATLRKWFDHVIVRPSFHDLVMAFGELLIRQRHDI